jgi:hypothetical protein
VTRESVSPKRSEFVKPLQELVEKNKGEVGFAGRSSFKKLRFSNFGILECPSHILSWHFQRLPLLDLDL